MEGTSTWLVKTARLDQVRQQQLKLKQNPRYERVCRRLDPDESAHRVALGEKHVIRFRMPDEGSITVHDHLRGDMTFENRSLDDSILIKSNGLAVYHLAAMADDHLMGITHVIRGAEWLPTFPLHMHIIRAFSWPEPDFVHLSVFLKPSGKGKMSKRESAQLIKDDYSIFIDDLRGLGYLPEAVVNWISLMGWSYDDHTEFFSMRDLIEKFSIDRLNPSPAAINFTKLDHFNGLHIRSLSTHDLAQRVKPVFEAIGLHVQDEMLFKVAPLIQPRIVTLEDAPAMAGFFFQENVEPAPEELIGDKMTPAESAAAARDAYQELSVLPEISLETAEIPIRNLAEKLGLSSGQLFGILRVAVTGQKVSPPLFESMEVIGREKVLERIYKAIEILEKV